MKKQLQLSWQLTAAFFGCFQRLTKQLELAESSTALVTSLPRFPTIHYQLAAVIVHK
jgi:hypothetical protein